MLAIFSVSVFQHKYMYKKKKKKNLVPTLKSVLCTYSVHVICNYCICRFTLSVSSISLDGNCDKNENFHCMALCGVIYISIYIDTHFTFLSCANHEIGIKSVSVLVVCFHFILNVL